MVVVLSILLAYSLIALVATLVRKRHLSEEMAFLRRDLGRLRQFFHNFPPTELVRQVLSRKAVELKNACDEQMRLMQGGWTPPATIDGTNEDLVEAYFRNEHAEVSRRVQCRKEDFWSLRKDAISAADATGRSLDYFGVSMDGRVSWKDYLPEEPLVEDLDPKPGEGLKMPAHRGGKMS